MLGDQDGWGTNRLSKAESILGAGTSQIWGLGRPKIYHEVEDTLENIGHITPIQALKDWHKKQPELFKKKIYDLSGLDTNSWNFSPGVGAR